jgi:transcription antitermination factor NusG
VKQQGRGTDWVVLRTSGRSTLVLAKTLKQDGLEAWSPAQTLTAHVPRMNVRRDVTLPMLPSFVFVRSLHLHELLLLSKMPNKPRRVLEPNEHPIYHRDFTVFRYLDGIPLIADEHLEPLRDKEREAIPRKSRPGFDRGVGVRVNSGAFEGLKGRVERCKSGYALVIFTDWNRPVQIPTFLLAEDASFSRPISNSGSAANKAASGVHRSGPTGG